MSRLSRNGWLPVMLLATAWIAWPQGIDVTARVELVKEKGENGIADKSNVVVWLTRIDADGGGAKLISLSGPAQHPQLIQKDKSFKPHLLVVPAGTVVSFPNHDPFFHNVFSLFEGKRFDLGLYESGAARQMEFDRPGTSYIFCNIHPQMSAVVMVMETPYYGVSDRSGRVQIPEVPPGRYRVHVWYERSLPGTLRNLAREIAISESSSSLGTLRLQGTEELPLAHKNKYGQDYETPAPESPGYEER
jgi:plastocyanin